MIARKVSQLRRCEGVNVVYVNTDDQEIAEAARDAGAVLMVGRDYAGDTRTMIEDSARQADADVILWAHPTNPLVRPETYDDAITQFVCRRHPHDSLLSVTPIKRHAWVHGEPFNYDPYAERHRLAADLPPVHFQDGAIFIQTRERMIKTRYFFGSHPILFEIPWYEGWDIDTREEYEVAAAMSDRTQ